MQMLFHMPPGSVRRVNAEAPHIHDLVPHKEDGEVVGIVLRYTNEAQVDTFAQWLSDEGIEYNAGHGV